MTALNIPICSNEFGFMFNAALEEFNTSIFNACSQKIHLSSASMSSFITSPN